MRKLNFRKSLLLPVLCVGMLAACTNKEAQGKDATPVDEENDTASLTIVRQWMLPADLVEISGIAPYKNLLACIQDEDGIIFLFNPATGQVEKRIPFGESGDYEGIAVVGETAWVLRSDGQLFEVSNFNSGTPAVKKFPTPLTSKQNTESLTYDSANSRLLVAVKAKSLEDAATKDVYAFDLNQHELNTTPVYRLKVSESTKLQPSEIALNLKTSELYVLDGPKSILYIMNTSGTPKRTYPLDQTAFPQPEGLAFTPDGKFCISTEGGKQSGAILEVTLNQ